jgi:hypothetical protein
MTAARGLNPSLKKEPYRSAESVASPKIYRTRKSTVPKIYGARKSTVPENRVFQRAVICSKI